MSIEQTRKHFRGAWVKPLLWGLCSIVGCWWLLIFFVLDSVMIDSPPMGVFYPLVVFGTVVVLIVVAANEQGKRRWAWVGCAISYFLIFCGLTIQFVDVFVYKMARESAVAITDPFFIIAYIIGICATALYFPPRALSAGSTRRVILDSLTVGCAAFVILESVFVDIIRAWFVGIRINTGNLPFLAFDISVLFAIFTVLVRFRSGAGPLVRFVSLSLLSLTIGDVFYLFRSMSFNGILFSKIGISFYILQSLFLAIGAYRGIQQPPFMPVATIIRQSYLEWLSWMIPYITLLIALASTALVASASTQALLSLLVVGITREIFSMREYQEIQGRLQIKTIQAEQANEHLMRTNGELRVANVEIERLLKSLATETNAAVHDVRGYLKHVRKTGDDLFAALHSGAVAAADITRYEQRFDRTMDALHRLISYLRDVILLRHEALHLMPTPVNLLTIVDTVVEQLEMSFHAVGCDLTVKVEQELPLLSGDPQRLERVLYNLVDNAFKYTVARHQPGSGGLVQIQLMQESHWVVCRIEDNGIGMAAEQVARLGTPFTRFADVEDSMGLGLAYSKAIVEQSGGTFHITSPGLGQGTCVTLTLPCLSVLDQPAVPALYNVRCLIVEDDLGTATDLARQLEQVGMHVGIVSDPAAAKHYLWHTAVDVALLDYDLGGPETGTDLAVWMRDRADLRRTLRISLSDASWSTIMHGAPSDAFHAHLAKSAPIPALIASLQGLLG